jgi:hypothetical protein
MQYDNGERVPMDKEIVFDEATLRRVLARMGIQMSVLESERQVLLEIDRDNGWYLDMRRI